MDEQSLEEKVGKFDSLSNAVRDFPESSEFKILKTGLIDRATKYFKNEKGELQPELVINESKSRQMAKDLYEFSSVYVAKHYLKLTDDEIKAKKTIVPADGKSVFDTLIRDIMGVDEDAIYNTLKQRGSVSADQIPTLVSSVYDTHDRVDTGKRTSQGIKDNNDANDALKYLEELKRMYPKSLAALSVPTTYQTINEVQGLLASAVRAIPRDYQIKIAEKYKKAA